MNENVLQDTLKKSDLLKEWVLQFKHKRYFYQKALSIGSDFFVGIRGIRGIGKTVLLLQLANEFKQSVYFSADSSYLAPHSLPEIINGLIDKGAKNIFIDEIHSRPNWGAEIKTIYDEHSCRVFFSGSNSTNLKTTGADLSRRALIYELKPVSFREFLNIKKGFDIKEINFKTILSNSQKLSFEYHKASNFFDEYLQYGGVLYTGDGFKDSVDNAIQKIVSNDLLALRSMNIKYEQDVYNLLYLIANSGPFEVSYSTLSKNLGFSKTFLIKLVHDLAATGIIKTIFPCKQTLKDVKKEPKIFFAFPFRSFFAEKQNKGALREDFFVNHVAVSCYLKNERGEKTADFVVENKTIEVGGAGKTFKQKPDFIAIDSKFGEKGKIPLYLFGFTY